MYASGTTSKWLPMQCPIKGFSSILPRIRICLSETEESAATSEKVPAVDISLGHLRALHVSLPNLQHWAFEGNGFDISRLKLL